MLGLHRTSERVRVGVVNHDVHELASLSSISIKNDNAIARRSTNHLHQRSIIAAPNRQLAGPFHQDLHGRSNKQRVVFFANGILQCQQFIIPRCFYALRHIIFQSLGCLRPRANRVFEYETVF
jgi:hypothetical protein